MGKKYDACVRQVKRKMKKTYKCDSEGNPNKRGRHRCRSNPHAICSKIK